MDSNPKCSECNGEGGFPAEPLISTRYATQCEHCRGTGYEPLPEWAEEIERQVYRACRAGHLTDTGWRLMVEALRPLRTIARQVSYGD